MKSEHPEVENFKFVSVSLVSVNTYICFLILARRYIEEKGYYWSLIPMEISSPNPRCSVMNPPKTGNPNRHTGILCIPRGMHIISLQ